MNAKLPSDFLPQSTELHELHTTQETKPFPTHLLPKVLGDLVKEVARVTQTPEAMAGPLTLGNVSASIGKGLVIKGHAERITPPNLYILLGAKSGTGKSECAKIIFKPFIDYANEKHQEWIEEVLPGLKADKECIEAEIKELIKGLKKELIKGLKSNGGNADKLKEAKKKLARKESEMLKEPRYHADNVTGEKLAILISNQTNETMALLSSDARDCIDILGGKYQKNKTDESFYLKAYSRDCCTFDRVSRPSIIIKEPQLAIVWAVQPDKITMLFNNNKFTDGGLMPRFLALDTYCDAQIRTTNDSIQTKVLEEYDLLINRLLLVLHADESENVIQLSDEVISVFTNYFNGIVSRRKGGGELEDIHPYAARWEENALKIAICLHAAKHQEHAMTKDFSTETAHEAIELMKWFAEQQLGLLQESRDKQSEEKKMRVHRLIDDNGGQCTRVDVYRKRIASNAGSAEVLLTAMVEKGFLTEEKQPSPKGGGHPQTIYKSKL
jgi:hypothetical protein